MDKQSRPSAKTVNAMKARQSFGEMLEQVYYRGDRFIIERAGKPMAALVPVSLLEGYQKNSIPLKNGHDTQKGNKLQPKKRRT